MERAAIYRRALAPIMLQLGALGVLASAAGLGFGIDSVRGFGIYWIVVSVLGITAAYLKVRRQALTAAEPFWSPPTRRVTQAVLPPLFAGLIATILILAVPTEATERFVWIPAIWMGLYGCAIHAAGFFMPRGMKLFGWGFIVCGCAVAATLATGYSTPSAKTAHLLMGAFFGGLHLAYGVYLYFTERKNEA